MNVMPYKLHKDILLQINSVCNWGSTGRIAEDIGVTAMRHGWRSIIAYGQKANPSKSETYRIGNDQNIAWHVMMTRLFDRHGLESRGATSRLVEFIKKVMPDIIHLHNIHDYYVNYPILFQFLKEFNRPVVWTLHDCWSFTGHCSHFELANCFRWKECCHDCPNRKLYPKSWWFDRSTRNYWDKKHYFCLPDNITLVPVSDWLANYLRQSFLNKSPIHRIHNGIDTDVFQPQEYANEIVMKRYGLNGKHLVLGVASVWTKSKGLADFYELRRRLGSEYDIMVIGLSNKQIKDLPNGIIGLSRTNGTKELADLYSAADVLFNPTLEESLSLVNLEAQSCGTPVVTYRTGGCPETIENVVTGYVIPQHDINAAENLITMVCSKEKKHYEEACRNRIIKLFRKEDKYEEYMELYKKLLGGG